MPTALTRGQIKSRALRRAFPVGRGLPDGAHPDSFFVNEELDDVADEIMASVEECYLFFDIDVVSGQVRYCFPPLLTICGCICTPPTATGSPFNLSVRKTEEFILECPSYLSTAVSGTPTWLATEGQTAIVPWPTPDYSQAAGLTPHGIGLWDNAAWSDNSATCPLPRRQHMCLVYGLAYRLASPGSPEQRQAWGQFSYLKGQINSEMADLVTSARSRAPGPSAHYPSGPLNM